MRNARKPVFLLSLAVLLLFTCVFCANGGGKQGNADVDLFDRTLSVQVERTNKDGDSHYLYALFPDGKTGFYQSTQPGVLPELRNVDSGKTVKLKLSDYRMEEVEDSFRQAVYSFVGKQVKDPDAFLEKLQAKHGFDIFSSYPSPLAMRTRHYALTSAQSDFIFLTDYNTGVGGAIASDGTLYNYFRDDNGSFEPLSGFGTKILGAYGLTRLGILDTKDLSFETIDVFTKTGFRQKESTSYCRVSTAAYLADGSIAAVLSEQWFVDHDRFEEDWLAVIRPDGGTELYAIGDEVVSSGFCIVSGDPNFVVVEPASIGTALPRLVNRTNGEVCALKVDGSSIVSVPLAEAMNARGLDGAFMTIDVLSDGITLLVRDGGSGALAIFRPETMQTKLIKIRDDDVYGYTDYAGDRRGRLCAISIPRGGMAERGILLTIVDGSGNRIF